MKSNKFRRSIAFLMSVLMMLTTFASDLTAITATAEGPAESGITLTTDRLSSETYVNGTKVTKSAVVDGDQITFTFKVDGSTTQQREESTEYTKTDVVFVMDLSNSMITSKTEKVLTCTKEEHKHTSCNAGNCNNWRHAYNGNHSDSCYTCGKAAHTHSNSSCYKNQTVTVDRLTPAKEAAKSFTERLLADELKDYVRVGVASFGTKAHTETGLSNNKATVLSKIDAINLEKTKYGESGGTNIQAGLATAQSMLASSTAQNKYIVILSDGVPTYAAQGSGTGKSVTLNNGDKITLYNSLGSTIIGEGNAISDNVYKSTLTQAYKAKDAGISVFAIAYDLSNADSKTMVNVATANSSDASYFFNASSTTNDVASSISNVMAGIAKQIEASVGVASAQGIVINDKLPSYIEFNAGQNVEGVTFDSDLGGFTMNIGSPMAGTTITKEITATISMDDMIETFAINDPRFNKEENIEAAKAAVRAQMASSAGLAVSLNGNVVINFKDADGNPQTPNKDIRIDSDVAAAEVPTEIFHAYDYEVRFTVDGEAISETGSYITGKGYVGEVISTALPKFLQNADVYDQTSVTGMPDGEQFTVTADGKKSYTININHKKYNVTFKNGENVISSVDYFWNDTVVIPANPTKDGDAQYSYDFTGWNPVVATNVNGSAVYTAKYEQKVNAYNVFFKNDDGTILNGDGKGEVYPYGSTPEYKGATPTKPETESQTFTFAGWDKTITEVTGDVTYTATYTGVDKLFTVTFKNYDGTVLATLTDLKWGDAVAYSGATPVKPADNENTYTFANWSPAVAAECNGNATYVAQFSSEKITYTVKFVVDGKTVSEQKLNWGAAVTVPENPTKAEDNYNTYEFKNWTPSVSETCKGDATYTAVFDATAKEYTITFLNEDGSVYDSYKVGYGVALTTPANPTKESTDTTKYTFAGWTPVVPATCEGNATFTATFDETARYTVIFMNGNTEVAKFIVDDGATITAPAFADLTKAADETFTYTCTGWDKEVVTEVHASATYNAVFTGTYVEYTVRFLNEDGSEISSAVYHYGDDVTEATATKANTQEYTYTFAGWTPEFVAKCEGSVDYTAQFSSKKNQYTVNFVDYDGTVIATITEDYGTPFEAPADPERNADKTYTYEFAGWDKTVADAVTENVTYTATYDRTYIDYTVKFVDEDGNEVATFVKHYNETIEVPEVPAKEADDQYTYVPTDWTPSVNTTVTENVTYEPVYRNVLNKYTVTFYNGQNVYDQKEYEYGSKVELPANPSKAADETYTYEFAGWTPEVVDVVNNADYYAVFTPVFVDYKVNFYGAEGKFIVTKTAHYNGNVVAPTAAAPTGMHFTGWDKEFNPVTKDIDVYAQFAYNTYKAGFYVVKPDRLSAIKAEPEGISAGMVAQSTSDYIDTKTSAEFTYEFAPNKTVGEYFGAHKVLNNNTKETTVEDIFGTALPTVGTLTYTTAKGNTLKLSAFDWYVIKNAENSTGSNGWHVDGYASEVELVAPALKDLNYVLKYTGEVLNAKVAEKVAADVAKLNTADKTFTVKEVIFGRDIQDVDTTYTAKAVVEYASEGYKTETSIDVYVTVEAVDVVVTINAKDVELTYNGKDQTADVEFDVTIDSDVPYSEADFTFSGATTVTGKKADTYAFGLTKADFANTNKNVNVAFNVNDGELVIVPKTVSYAVGDITKVYGDEDPDFKIAFEGIEEGDEILYNIFREEGENVGFYDIYVVFGTSANIRPFALLDEEEVEEAVEYANDNYNFVFAGDKAGQLEITKRVVTVSALNASKNFGDADPKFVATIANDKFNDVAAAAWREIGPDKEIAGNYTIYVTTKIADELAQNYDIVVKNGVFTINTVEVEEVPVVTPTPVPPTPVQPTPVEPTPVEPTPVEPTPVEPEETVEIVPEDTPLAPEVDIAEDDTPKAPAPVVDIEPEPVPMAAAHCWIHWVILADALICAVYAALRGIANARALKDETEAVEE